MAAAVVQAVTGDKLTYSELGLFSITMPWIEDWVQLGEPGCLHRKREPHKGKAMEKVREGAPKAHSSRASLRTTHRF